MSNPFEQWKAVSSQAELLDQRFPEKGSESFAEIRDLKERYHQARAVERLGTSDMESSALLLQAPEIAERLIAAKRYITDIVAIPSTERRASGGKDARERQPGHEIAIQGSFLRAEIRDRMAPEVAGPVIEVLDAYLDFIKDREIFTRPGLEGLSDLVSDSLLLEHIEEQLAAKRFIRDQSQEVTTFLDAHPLTDLSLGDDASSIGMWLDRLPERAYQQGQKLVERHDLGVAKDIIRLQTFLETTEAEHEFTPLDETVSEWPLELQLAAAQHPEAARDLRMLVRSGLRTVFHTRTRTDHETIDAIHRVSVNTQYNFINHWLTDLVQRDRAPDTKIGEHTLEQVAHKRDALARLRKKIGEMERQSEERSLFLKHELDSEFDLNRQAILEERLTMYLEDDNKQLDALREKAHELDTEIRETTETDFRQDVERVRVAAKGFKTVMVFEAEKLSPSERAALDRVNARLQDINGDFAVRQMTFDVADEQTHEAQETIKKLMYIGPLAHGLELMNLGVAAKLFTASADDLMGEWAEVKALLGAGFTWRELLPRIKLLVPVFGGASAGSRAVDPLIEEGHELAAGGVFGAASVALSLTTVIQSMKIYKANYERLVAEGKITGKDFLAASPEFKKQWARFSEEIKTLDKPTIIARVKETLDTLGDAVDASQRELILKDLQAIDLKELTGILARSANMEAWMKAIKQDFNNPVRMGVLLGSTISPMIGIATGALAPGVLHNGFALAGIGSAESLIGAMTVVAARKINAFKWELEMKERLREQEKKSQERRTIPPSAGVLGYAGM